MTLGHGPYLDGVRRAVGANEGNDLIGENHGFCGLDRSSRLLQVHLDDQFDGADPATLRAR